MKTLYIDNSTLRAVAACDTEAVLKYIYNLASPEDIAVFKSGTDAHEAFRMHFEGHEPAKCLLRFKKLYRDWAEENVPTEGYLARLGYKNLNNILSTWLEKHPIDALPFTPRKGMVEIPFQYPLDEHGDIIYTGAMDLVVKDQDVDFAPVDNKTTGRVSADWVSTFRNDSQFSGYMWACSQHTGEKVLRGYVNAIEFSQLPSSDRECAKHKLPFSECYPEHMMSRIILITRTPGQIEQWKRNALKLSKKFAKWKEWYGDDINSVKKTSMGGSFYGHCRFCTFSEFCANGQPVKNLKSMYVKSVWNPLDRHFGGDPLGEKSKAEKEDDGQRSGSTKKSKRAVSDE